MSQSHERGNRSWKWSSQVIKQLNAAWKTAQDEENMPLTVVHAYRHQRGHQAVSSPPPPPAEYWYQTGVVTPRMRRRAFIAAGVVGFVSTAIKIFTHSPADVANGNVGTRPPVQSVPTPENNN